MKTEEDLQKQIARFVGLELAGTRTHVGKEVEQVTTKLGYLIDLAIIVRTGKGAKRCKSL